MRVGSESGVQARLERELRSRFGLSLNLRVVWMPNPGNTPSSEVKGDTVYVYESEEDGTVKTLRHEVVDHMITSRIVKPLSAW